jgi:predicted glycoside hydrolase/deacetylase ChbG (UPF0249 family)
MTVPFILCADDYALAPGVSRAILHLIERGRISATGCMTVSPFWPDHALWLRPWAGRVDVGLHFTLTDHTPLGDMPRLAPDGWLPPLGRLMARALTGRLDREEIRAELERQLFAFTRAFGAPPAFIDGHQHVHLLPGVREAVTAAAVARPGTWVRDCREPLAEILRRGVAPKKALTIAALGTGFGWLIQGHALPANGSFRGVHDFSGREPFGQLMERFLTPPLPRRRRAPALVMVHPGIPDDALRRADSVVEPRRAELDYLAGDGFAALLARLDCRPVRFAEAMAAFTPPPARP